MNIGLIVMPLRAITTIAVTTLEILIHYKENVNANGTASATVSANLGNANAIFVTGNMEVVEWKVFDLCEGLVFPANMKYPLRPLTLGALAGVQEGGMIYTN